MDANGEGRNPVFFEAICGSFVAITPTIALSDRMLIFGYESSVGGRGIKTQP